MENGDVAERIKGFGLNILYFGQIVNLIDNLSNIGYIVKDMINRDITAKLLHLLKKYPVIALTGQRQSGKTFLIRNLLSKKPYVSLEDPDKLDFALNDPRGFLSLYPKGAILDEIQRAPKIFSYLQGIVDEQNKSGMFILTGSQNFLLLENITQTLAGRVGILKLLPFNLSELKGSQILPKSLEEILYTGMYPRIYDKKINPKDFYPNYIQTYLEREVRQIKNISDLNTFQRFIRMCAARTGQLLNLSSLAIDCGITHNTAKSWISILEASYIVHLLYPHYKNFNKRLVKTPKLYFFDTGLVCSLVGINKKEEVLNHSQRGNLFETFIISELIKKRFNQGHISNLYFWRDKTGHEIDCIVESGAQLIPIEIKSGKTVAGDFFSGINYLKKISNIKGNSYLIYGGDFDQKRKDIYIKSWKDINQIIV